MIAKNQRHHRSLTELFQAIGHRANPNARVTQKFIKDHKVEVVVEFPRGRGVTRLISQEEFDRLRSKLGSRSDPAESPGRPDPQLHIIALEKQVADLKAVVAGNTQAINELIKSGNLMCDRLNKVLAQLGEPTS